MEQQEAVQRPSGAPKVEAAPWSLEEAVGTSKLWLTDASDALRRACASQADAAPLWAAAAGLGSAALSAGITALVFRRRQHALQSRIGAIQQELLEVRRRSEESLAKAERFGAGEKLARALLPVCDSSESMLASLRTQREELTNAVADPLLEGAEVRARPEALAPARGRPVAPQA